MAIDIKKMKAKLAALSNKGSKKDILWGPKEGQKYTVRILPSPDGDPFKEFWFHYDLAPGGFLCPKKNYGEPCAACEFASKLYKVTQCTSITTTIQPQLLRQQQQQRLS